MKITTKIVDVQVKHANAILNSDIDRVGQNGYQTLEMNGGSKHLFSGTTRECSFYLRGMMDGLSIKRRSR